MIAQAGAAMRHSSALPAMRRAPVRLPASRHRPVAAVSAVAAYPRPAPPQQRPLFAAITVSAAAYQTGVRILKFAAAVLASATIALAVMNYQDARQPASVPEAAAVEAAAVEVAAIEPVRNETVVYRQLPPKSQERATEAEDSAYSAGRFYGEDD